MPDTMSTRRPPPPAVATAAARRAAARRRQASGTIETLTERAYRVLEEEIVTLALPPGEVVSEALLSDRLRIGRTPIREALQRLARERLVRIMPRRGIVVAGVDVREQLRLLEVRREVERFLARTAARRADPGQRERLRAIADGMDARRRRRRRDSLPAPRPRVEPAGRRGGAQRVRRRRHDPDARPVAPLLVHPLAPERRPARSGARACRPRPRHRGRPAGAGRRGLRPTARLHRGVHARDGERGRRRDAASVDRSRIPRLPRCPDY